MSAAGLSVSLGLFLVFLMAMMTDWRTVALICIIFPLITFISQCFVRKIRHDFNHFFFNQLSVIDEPSYLIYRYRKHQFGCYRNLVPKKRANHCNGFAVGCQPKRFNANLKNCNAMKRHRVHAQNANEMALNVHIRRRPLQTKSEMYFVNGR